MHPKTDGLNKGLINLKKRFSLLLGLLLSLMACVVVAQSPSPFEGLQQAKVVEPFLNLRTGPGVGFPVFHAVEQGEWVGFLRRKTTWVKLRDSKGREGWAHQDDVERLVDSDGRQIAFDEPEFGNFATRRWEAGVLFGDFEGAPVISGYGGYWLTPNLSAELWGSQVLGDFSEILLVNVNIVHQPFPEWRVSPFFTLGTGSVWINPKSTLVNTEDRREDSAHVGFGARWYVTDRYFLRFEYKDYVIFTDRERNEEAEEWKLGLSVFF